MPKKKLTPYEFVKIWQTSSSLDEVCKRSGLEESSARARYYNYLKHGVPLKIRKKRGGKIDWEKLADLAASLLLEDDGDGENET